MGQAETFRFQLASLCEDFGLRVAKQFIYHMRLPPVWDCFSTEMCTSDPT